MSHLGPLLALLIACGDNIPPDDGFGEPCTPILDGRIFTLCTTSTGSKGVCAVDVCRRWCDGDGHVPNPRACPTGQHAIPTIDDRCWCEPLWMRPDYVAAHGGDVLIKNELEAP